jgi:hypothetical protein
MHIFCSASGMPWVDCDDLENIILNHGILRPNHYQGKRLLNKEEMKNNMKTYEGKTCFMSTYHLTTLIVF